MSLVPDFSDTIMRIQIIDAARTWLGTPYLHQASAKGAGCDCLGLLRGVWRDVYGREPEVPPAYTPDWNERAFYDGDKTEPLLAAARRHLHEKPIDERKPGDVLIFRIVNDGPAKHCAMLSAPDRIIHAYAGREVVDGWLNRWWRARIVGVFSFPGTR